jgi:DNA-binding GntR family transcriptional regulator
LNAGAVGARPSHIVAISAGSLQDQVRRSLEAAMMAGELKPGELYSAPALGERFGVSATPVREAMLDLANDGFVVAERNRGFRVVEMSAVDLDEICPIRLLLEVPSTVQVAKIIAAAPASAACSAQATDSREPYAPTAGITEKPSGAASIAVVTRRARSSDISV